MNRTFNNIGLVLVFVFTCFSSSGENIKKKLDHEIDSLLSLIDTIQSPENKIDHLISLSWRYDDRGRTTKNLQTLLKAKQLADSFQLTNKLGDIHYALGIFYNRQEKDLIAVEHCKRSLQYYLGTNDTPGVGAACHRLGLAFFSLNRLDSARFYLERSYTIRKEYNYPYPMAASSNALGLVLMKQDSLTRAIEYFKIAHSMWSKLEDLEGISIVSGNLGVAYRKLKDYNKALYYLNESMQAANSSNALVFAKETALELSSTYETLHELDSAMKYLKIHISTKDSLFNLKEQSKIIDMQEKYETLEKEKTILQQSSLLENKEWEQKIAYLIIGSIMALLIIILYALYAKRKANALLFARKIQIEEANEELNQQNEEIIAISDMIDTQNKMLSHRNDEIMDSIRYAKKIQQSILPALSPLAAITSSSFVYFNPKEVVSGDFYWFEQLDNQLLWAVVDCTGHGVPGALMSIVGFNGLNRIVIENQVHEPSKVLERLSDYIVNATSNNENFDSDEGLKDGLDIAFCQLDLTTNVLTFSGAFNSCYIVREGALTELKGTRRPVGKYWAKNKKQFGQESFQLLSEDWVFLSSDGFADQFGGVHNKKMGYKHFRTVLTGLTNNEPGNYSDLLDQELHRWAKNEEQIDDICIFGIQIQG